MCPVKNLRFTKQRQLIIDELRQLTSHPTADDLYHLVQKKIPKISLGTVYRNLTILSEQGIIQKLNIGGSHKHFDGNISNHYHICCSNCDRIDDLEIPPDFNIEKKISKLTSFKILKHNLCFIGICPDCDTGGLEIF